MSLKTRTQFQRTLRKVRQPHTGWTDVFPAVMGKADGTVQTGTPGEIYVRNSVNGQVVVVHNSGNVPSIANLQIEVGRRVDKPSLWQIKGQLENYNTPAGGDILVGYHADQHRFPEADTVWVDRKQVTHFTVLVSDAENFIVQVYGGVAVTPNGVCLVENQTIDLSSYVPTSGAKYVSIVLETDGTLTVLDGTEFESRELAAVTDIPLPAVDQYLLAFALLYEFQESLSNNDIRLVQPFGVEIAVPEVLDDLLDVEVTTPSDGDILTFDSYSQTWINAPNSSDVAASIHAADEKATIHADDEIGGADSEDSWSLVKWKFSTLKAWVIAFADALYASISHGHVITELSDRLDLTGYWDVSLSPGTTYNNWNPASLDAASQFWIDSSAGSIITITGLQGGSEGRVMILTRIGAATIRLKHQSASSDAENRFYFPDATDFDFETVYQSIIFQYIEGNWMPIQFAPKPGGNTPSNISGSASAGASTQWSRQDHTHGGGLTYTPTTVTTGNVTAANGNLYACTIAGMTADRDFNLPTPGAAGERIGVFVLDGDDAFELIIKANSVEITRVFIANEYMTFISTGTGAGDWKIEVDGRIPCKGLARRAAAQSINTSSTTKVEIDTAVLNIGGIVDVITNDRINIRRAGNYELIGFVTIDNMDDQNTISAQIFKDGSVLVQVGAYLSITTSNIVGRAATPLYLDACAVGAYFELYVRHTEGTTQNTVTTASNIPYILVKEIF